MNRPDIIVARRDLRRLDALLGEVEIRFGEVGRPSARPCLGFLKARRLDETRDGRLKTLRVLKMVGSAPDDAAPSVAAADYDAPKQTYATPIASTASMPEK